MNITSLTQFKNLRLVKTKDDHDILVNPNDIYIGRNLISYGEWEPDIRNLLQKIVTPGMKTLDVGANIGAHTLLLSKLVGENGKVYAFEPNKINHDMLLFSAIYNRCFNIDIYQYGCDDKESVLYMENKWSNQDKEENYGCIVLKDTPYGENDVKIQSITIDSLNIEIDFAKVDAEYMEKQVINGMRKTIERCKPIIIVEIHPDEIPVMRELFDELKYSLTQVTYLDFLAKPL